MRALGARDASHAVREWTLAVTFPHPSHARRRLRCATMVRVSEANAATLPTSTLPRVVVLEWGAAVPRRALAFALARQGCGSGAAGAA
jgi:hypothetical protein